MFMSRAMPEILLVYQKGVFTTPNYFEILGFLEVSVLRWGCQKISPHGRRKQWRITIVISLYPHGSRMVPHSLQHVGYDMSLPIVFSKYHQLLMYSLDSSMSFPKLINLFTMYQAYETIEKVLDFIWFCRTQWKSIQH